MSEEEFNVFLAAINQMKVWEMEERLNLIDYEVNKGNIDLAKDALRKYVKDELK